MACAEHLPSGRIYCLGGQQSGGAVDEILEFDPTSPTQPPVVKAARLPTVRSLMACAAEPANGRIYCFGGYDGNDEAAVDEILEYDPGGDTLRVLNAVLPAPRMRVACAAAPGTERIYCFGGDSSRTPVDSILEYITPSHILLQVGDPGDGTGAIANTWSVFSSREFKRDVAALSPAEHDEILCKLKATDAVRFRYADDPQRNRHLGVIAEEAPADILSPGGKAVSLADFTTFLMAAIKAQQSVIEEKECQIADLQTQMAETQKRLSGLEALAGRLEQRGNGGAR